MNLQSVHLISFSIQQYCMTLKVLHYGVFRRRSSLSSNLFQINIVFQNSRAFNKRFKITATVSLWMKREKLKISTKHVVIKQNFWFNFKSELIPNYWHLSDWMYGFSHHFLCDRNSVPVSQSTWNVSETV